jgi:hypothetical protein
MSSGWLAQPNNIADAAKTNIFITVRSIILSKNNKSVKTAFNKAAARAEIEGLYF